MVERLRIHRENDRSSDYQLWTCITKPFSISIGAIPKGLVALTEHLIKMRLRERAEVG